jgi:hypothetical protein
VISFDNEPAEVELGDPPVAKADHRPRWTIGRVANDLLIAVFVASITLSLLSPLVPGMCGHTPERDAATISGLILLVRPTWRLLKAWNDAAERWLDRLTRPNP